MESEVAPSHGAALRPSWDRHRVLAGLPLYLAFAITGVGVALPGALLPVMLQRWRLHDAQGGALFLLAWASSSLGALLVRNSLQKDLLWGSVSLAGGAMGLALCSGRWADAAISLFGFGLGLTMTTISLIRQQQAQNAGKEMVRLNLLWSIGACACPSLTLRTLRTGDSRPIFFAIALAFGLLILWASLHPQPRMQATAAPAYRPWIIFQLTPFSLIAMAFLITGIEASAGGWLATYTQRGAPGVARTITVPTCFWAGLLLSRLFWSLRKPGTDRGYLRVVRGSLLLMLAASLVLVASRPFPFLLVAAGCLGFGIGPTYPLILAWALRFQRGGAIFFVAGVGSAVVPWLTGLVSSRSGSLRKGMVVPLAASAMMFLFSLRLRGLEHGERTNELAAAAGSQSAEPQSRDVSR